MAVGDWLTGAGLAGAAIAYLANRSADRRRVFADERRRVYTAFLVRQSELQDAYRVQDDPQADDDGGRPDPQVGGATDHPADAARARAWEALAELRLLAPQDVETPALEYAKRIGKANPRRPQKYRPFPHHEAGPMRNAFIAAAREDLVPRRTAWSRFVKWLGL